MDKALRAFCERLLRSGIERPTVTAISTIGMDAFVELLLASARRLLAAAIDAEFRHFLHARGIPVTGANRVVRNGLHPERLIGTGIGTVPVRLPKLRSRKGAPGTFHSALVPRYARRARLLNAEATDLYLRAIATGDLGQALVALIGPQSVALPPPVARELERWWIERCKAWREGPLLRCETRRALWSTLASPRPKPVPAPIAPGSVHATRARRSRAQRTARWPRRPRTPKLTHRWVR